MGRPANTPKEIERTRSLLIQSAMGLYLESGLDNVSLRRVAQRAGLSHTLVYRYFDDKNALLTELRMLCLESFRRAMQVADRPPADPVSRVRSVLLGALNFGQEHAAQYRLVFAHDQVDLEEFPELLAMRRDVFDSCVDLAQAAIHQRGLSIDALLLAHSLWSLVHGMLQLHTAGQLVHGLTLRQMAEPAIDSALLVLRAENPSKTRSPQTRAAHRAGVEP